MRAKSLLAGMASLASLGGWVYAVTLAAPMTQPLLADQTMLVLAIIGLPAASVGFLWLASPVNTQLTQLQTKRMHEKADIAQEQALLKIDALEAKIKTLETALSKALQRG